MTDKPTSGSPLPFSIAQAWYGPGQSIPPIAPPTTLPRISDYPWNTNINYAKRKNERVSFERLRQLAHDNYLIRVILEKVKARLCMVRWEFRLRAQAGEHLASVRERSSNDSRVKFLYKFFERPDGEHDFPEWMNAILEDRFVIDAASIWVARDGKDKIAHLVPIDGSTINRLIDARGMTPAPPYAAYQQLIKGMPDINFTQEDLLYMPANFRSDRLWGYCYDSETEILTHGRGFVRFSDLRDNEEVATRSPAGEFQWQRPLARINTKYEGQMIRLKSRSMDAMITPEHRVLVSLSSRSGKRVERVMIAKDFVRGLNHERKIPVTSTWAGTEVPERTFQRTAPSGHDFTISGDDFCALMGAYLAEGNIRNQGGIEVAQRKESKGWREYNALFDRLGGGILSRGRGFILTKRSITQYFRQFGHAHEKFIPQVILDATSRQIEIFLRYYGLGDGSFDARHNVSGRGQKDRAFGVRYTTVSKRLADGIMELEQKCGRSASIGIHSEAGMQEFNIGGKAYKSPCRESYTICVRYSEAMAVNAAEVTYSGKVHCVTVPNGIVYVRRNGKPYWCGNSETEQTIRLSETQINRAVWTLNHYTEGNIPELLVMFKSAEFSPEQIERFMSTAESQLNGQLGQRQRMFPLPDASVHELRGKELFELFDEWMARLFCYQMGEPPTGLVKAVNRASAQQMDDTREESGEKPYLNWIRTKLNRVIQNPLYFGWEDIECAALPDAEVDALKQAQVDQINVPLGITTVNEARIRDGKVPLDDTDNPQGTDLEDEQTPTQKAAGVKKNRLLPITSDSQESSPIPGRRYLY